jgi:hypothetical protein
MDRKPLDYADPPQQRRGWFHEWWEWVVFVVLLAILAFCFLTPLFP